MSDPAADFRNWISKGGEDLLCIHNEMAAEKVPWAIVSFHAQQAAEKYLKAFLVSHGKQPEKIHDLRSLLRACRQMDLTLAALDDDCSRLTDHAVDSRYPDLRLEDEERIAREAVAMAERICNAIRQRLPAS